MAALPTGQQADVSVLKLLESLARQRVNINSGGGYEAPVLRQPGLPVDESAGVFAERQPREPIDEAEKIKIDWESDEWSKPEETADYSDEIMREWYEENWGSSKANYYKTDEIIRAPGRLNQRLWATAYFHIFHSVRRAADGACEATARERRANYGNKTTIRQHEHYIGAFR